MKKSFLLSVVFGLMGTAVLAGQEKFPVESYEELPQFVKPDAKEWESVKGTRISWGSTHERYAKTSVPMKNLSRLQGISGWRGEKVAAQAVVWSRDGLEELSFEISDFKGPKGQVIPSGQFEAGFVRYVMADEVRKDGNCGSREDRSLFDSTMVADCIDPYLKTAALAPMNTMPVWISCRIPQDIAPGTYKGKVIFKDGERTVGALDLNILADSHVLPEPSQWHFHLLG